MKPSVLRSSGNFNTNLLPGTGVLLRRLPYTAPFLQRTQSQHFQNPSQEAETFRVAFESFRTIAKLANPVQYVGRHQWNTSRTKVIDNAIVGLVAQVKAQVKKELLLRCRSDSVAHYRTTW